MSSTPHPISVDNSDITEQGAIVTAHYNTNFAPLDKFAESRSQVVQADLSKEDEVAAMFDKATYTFGPVQILIINHAISVVKDEYIWEMSLDRWKTTMDANLTSTFLVAREYLRRLKNVASDLREEASIVLIGSTAGKYGRRPIYSPISMRVTDNIVVCLGEAGHADYAASKSGAHRV